MNAGNGKALAKRADQSLIAKKIISGLSVAGNEVALRAAVNDLAELPKEQIRDVLESEGLLSEPLALAAITAVSMDLNGGEEFSPVISALEPEELRDVVQLSPEIFSHDDFRVDADIADPSQWDLLTEKEAILIKQSPYKGRSASLHPFPFTKKAWLSGPWAVPKKDLHVEPIAATGYISAILNADRGDKWKNQALEAIDLKIVAFAAHHNSSIKFALQRNFPYIFEQIGAILEKGNITQLAIDVHDEAIRDLERFIRQTKKDMAEVEDLPAASLIERIRAQASAAGSAADDGSDIIKRTSREADDTFEALFRQGIPEK
jgi:hypothetical protein